MNLLTCNKWNSTESNFIIDYSFLEFQREYSFLLWESANNWIKATIDPIDLNSKEVSKFEAFSVLL